MYRLSKYARSIADAVPCIGLPLLEERLLNSGRGGYCNGLDWIGGWGLHTVPGWDGGREIWYRMGYITTYGT